MPSVLNFSSSGAARSRLAWNTSDDFGMTLSMDGLRFQRVMNVVALPADFLVVDLHVERQREFAAGKNRVEIIGERPEDVLAGLLAGRKITALAKAQHHREKAELRIAVGNGVVFAPDGADANAPERKDPGFHRGLADHFDDLAHVDPRVEIG